MGTIYGMALHEGAPAEGIEVRLVDADDKPVGETVSQKDGSFTFEVASGTWTLKWTSSGGDASDGQIEVPEGEDAEVEIEV